MSIGVMSLSAKAAKRELDHTRAALPDVQMFYEELGRGFFKSACKYATRKKKYCPCVVRITGTVSGFPAIYDEVQQLRRLDMSAEENKSLIRNYIETWNRGDLQSLSQYWSSDMRHHTRSQSHDYDEVKRIVESFMDAFPDLKWKIDDIIAEGDKVVTRMTAQATNTGTYMGIPPTGKKINCSVLGIARVNKGRIVEHWGVTDELAIMSQLGLLPEEYLAAMA